MSQQRPWKKLRVTKAGIIIFLPDILEMCPLLYYIDALSPSHKQTQWILNR